MHVNRLVSSLTFGVHAFCLNQHQESLKGPPCGLWKGEFCLQHMSQWMDRVCWWCHDHSEDVKDLQDVTSKPCSFATMCRRRNEHRDSNQRICWHLWLAPCFICSPNIRSRINTPKKWFIIVVLKEEKQTHTCFCTKLLPLYFHCNPRVLFLYILWWVLY